MQPATTVLLYGRTNAGKSTQIGRLAEHVYSTTKKRTRLYTADKGGVDPIRPYIDLGIIECVDIASTDPFVFLNKAVRGQVRGPEGKWIDGRSDDIGFYAFESLRGIAEALMLNMAQKAGQGVNIGGGSNISFPVSGDGETFKVSGSNMAHFGVAQSRMTEEVWESQRLHAQYVLWTSSVSKDDDTTAGGKVLGPDVIGKALTAEVPRWFNYTFRLDVIPAQNNVAERHLLYMGSHVDVGAGNASGMGNIRRPLDAPALTDVKNGVLEPADLVKALVMLSGGQDQAKDTIKKRLGL